MYTYNHSYNNEWLSIVSNNNDMVYNTVEPIVALCNYFPSFKMSFKRVTVFAYLQK